MIHLLKVVSLLDLLEFDLCLFGLQVGPTGLLLDLDLLLTGLLDALLELFELVLLGDHELMYGIVLESELLQGVGDLLLLLVTRLPRGDEVVRLQQRVLVHVCLRLLKAVLSHHYTSGHVVAIGGGDSGLRGSCPFRHFYEIFKLFIYRSLPKI